MTDHFRTSRPETTAAVTKPSSLAASHPSDRPPRGPRCGRGARRRATRAAVVATVLALGLAGASGCRNLVTMAVYLVRGTSVAAEYGGLKAKRVVVVCRPVASVAFRDTGVAHDLSRKLSSLLRERVRKIDVVDAQEVAAWIDERYDSDYTFTEVGEAFDADQVVGIELSEFNLYEGQTLYKGRATVRLVVYDLNEKDRIVFERDLPQIVWPPNVGVETSDRQKVEFRRQFVGVVADHIGRFFYSHDPYQDYAQDAAAHQGEF